jgi:hypothetical protein
LVIEKWAKVGALIAGAVGSLFGFGPQIMKHFTSWRLRTAALSIRIFPSFLQLHHIKHFP